MKIRLALIIALIAIWVCDTIVQMWTVWCIVFNPKRATEIVLAYDRVGNVAMGQGNETISSWAGRHNSWMERPINLMFEWLGAGKNHCDRSVEK